MIIILSGGPILEPLIAVTTSSFLCLGLLIFVSIKFFKSERYRQIKTQSSADQWVEMTLIAVLAIIVAFLLWCLFTFLFMGIAFGLTK